jgi:hypothetical protein
LNTGGDSNASSSRVLKIFILAMGRTHQMKNVQQFSLYMTKKTEHVEIVHNINFTKRLKDESNQRAFSDIK